MIDYLGMLRGSRILVTGGLGFVGHNLVKYLVNQGACVTVVDNCLNSSPEILGRYRDEIRLIRCDVLELGEYAEALSDTEYLFHLACVQIAASSSNPEYDLNVNALSTLRILEALKANLSPNFKRFVYTSSASVYGSTTRLPLAEDAYPHVLSNYAATKLLGENYTLIYGTNYGLPVSAVRYSNVYGYGQSPQNPYCGVLGKFVHNALTGRRLPVIGDGQQTRDYTFVADAVKATVLAGLHPAALNDVFNLGTGVETSVNNLAAIIKDFIPATEIERLPERDIDNIRRRVVDIEKIHQRLGWAPITDIRDGIEMTLDWYRTVLENSQPTAIS